MYSTEFSATLLTLLLATGQPVAGHMMLSYPAALLASNNPYTSSGAADYSYTSPLSASGSDYPCKGHLSVLNTSQGTSVATFAQGGTYNYTVTGGAVHNGGSCQASLSYDGGNTFTVINSYVGNCPIQTSGSFDFTVPTDAATGAAVFAWTWFNNVGNREMYMNCASVTISSGSTAIITSGKKRDEIEARDVAYSARPAIFVANIGNGCGTQAGTDLIFPAPGPAGDVVTSSLAGHTFAAPTGSCAAAVAASGSAGAAGSGAATAVATTSSAAAAVETSAPSSSPSTSSTTTLAGGVFITAATTSSSSVVTAAIATNLKTTPSSTKTTAASTPVGTATSGSGTTAYAQGTACTDEGAYNCVGGTAFQRCASGMWSAMIDMTSGTSCTPGTSDTLTYAVRRSSRRRFVGSYVRRGKLVREEAARFGAAA